jgi:hypothetical protein
VFAPRFAKNARITFYHLYKCSEEEKSKVIRVLNLWQKNSGLPFNFFLIFTAFFSGLRIWIESGFNDFVDPDTESGSRGQKNEEKMNCFLSFKIFF